MNNRYEEPESLSRKVLRGGAWVFALRITNRGLGFIRTIILARLLVPEDFGLLGIAMLVVVTLEIFSQTGFQAALIQKKENVESYLDTAWTISAVRGVLLFFILFFFAPMAASFFNSPKAALVIKIIAISSIFAGFRNIGVIFFQKELKFNKQFLFDFSATSTDLVVSVALTFVLRNVWALVWGGLVGNFIRLFMSYLLHPYRPRVRFEKVEAKELFGFGKWILGSSILLFLATQGADIFVGKMIGVTALGFYQIAFLLSNLPDSEITHVISWVTFPAYSKMQDDIPRLREAYLKVLQFTVLISIPLAVGIFILAPEFTKIFLGDKWLPMVPVMQVLAFASLVRSIAATAGPVFHGIGKPKIDTRWQVVRLIVLVVLLYPLTMRWGILGASISVLFSILVSTLGFSSMVIKITECEFKDFGKRIVLPMLSSIIMMVVVIVLKSSVQPTGFLEIFFIIGVGATSYFFLIFLFDSLLNYGIRKVIKESIELL